MILHRLFPGQQDDEEIRLVVREHWFHFATKFCVWLIFVAILFAFDHYLPIYLPSLTVAPYTSYIAVFKNIYVMFLMLGLFMIFTLYYLSVWIITNKRLVEVLQSGLFNQRISELTFPNIEDITSETNGMVGTFLSYGNVYVQTAGEKENFVFLRISNPKDIERLIFNLMDKHPEKGNE